MERLKGLLKQRDFHVLFFHVSLVLFGWPVVSFQSIDHLQSTFLYLFLVWTAMVSLLFLVSRSVDVTDPAGESRSSQGSG